MIDIVQLSAAALVGYPASAFDLVDQMSDDDILLVETGVNSTGISFRTFMDIVGQRVFSELGVGTMYDQDRNGYSRSDHNHDLMYNGVVVGGSAGDTEIFQANRVYQTAEQSVCRVYAHRYRGELPEEPRIGSLKFVYGKRKILKFPDCIRNGSFDGWVYSENTETVYGPTELYTTPNGVRTLPAYGVLGNDDQDNPAIVVPPLTSFFKPTIGPIREFV